MKKNLSFALMASVALMSLTGFAACSSSDDMDEVDNPNVVYDDQGKAGVKPEFVISFPRSVVNASTRMTDAVTQDEGTIAQFRGMDRIRLIPFKEEPTGTSEKLSNIMGLTSIQALTKPGVLNYKVYADQFVPIYTSNFLFYGKAIDKTPDTDITTMEDKFNYGVVKATGLTETDYTNPNGIVFNLEQINTSTDQQAGNAVGQKIVALMTSLAKTEVSGKKWSSASNKLLKGLYKNFIATTVSSSKNIAAILGMILDGLDRIPAADTERDLADQIKTNISAACSSAHVDGSAVTLNDDYSNYPSNIGLPDGAVRVRWDKTSLKFVDVTAEYGLGLNKVKITDYVYPAALWYFVSTPIKASNSIESGNYDSKTTWDDVVNVVYNEAKTKVDGNTQSVVLTKPVEYAVGRLETSVKMGSGTFYDGNGQEVVIGEGYTLTGLLIGGQNSVGFDFSTNKGSESWTIYDRKMANAIIAKPGITTAANQTLALETKKDQKIYAALELVNGGEAFQGADGIIPAGGTFYLTVELNPKAQTGVSGYTETVNKIVMKDYVTTIIVTIKNGTATAPAHYIKDTDGNITGVDTTDGKFDINGDGSDDTLVLDPDNGGPGWDTDGDGVVDIPILPNPATGAYPDNVQIPQGLGNAYNGIPDLSSPGVELGTSVDLQWKPGLTLTPSI